MQGSYFIWGSLVGPPFPPSGLSHTSPELRESLTAGLHTFVNGELTTHQCNPLLFRSSNDNDPKPASPVPGFWDSTFRSCQEKRGSYICLWVWGTSRKDSLLLCPPCPCQLGSRESLPFKPEVFSDQSRTLKPAQPRVLLFKPSLTYSFLIPCY